MQKRRMALALLLSFGLHIVIPFAETIAGRHQRNVESFDRVVSWPAWLCSALVPSGHGIPQLMFPLVFSLAFYAALFWPLITFYDRLRERSTSLAGGPDGKS